MPKETTEILFEELAKNQDDLGLFLDLHYGFDNFFRHLGIEFYETALWPGLQAQVKAHNQLHPQSQLQSKPAPHSRLVDIGKWVSWLSVVAPSLWPEGLEVGLAGEHSGGISGIYTQIVLNPVGKQEPATLKLFSAQSSVLIDKARQRFPGRKIGFNKDAIWFFYDAPYNSLSTKDGVLLMARDVAINRKGEHKPDQENSLSGRYIEDLLTWAEIASQVFG